MADFNTAIPSVAASSPALAEDVQIFADALTALTASWSDYSASFVIGAATTPPTKGSSTYSAWYRRLGHTVDYSFSITIGSGWSSGSGAYRIPLPVASVAPRIHVGRLYVQDSGTGFLTGSLFFNSASDTYLSMITHNSTTVFLGSAGPGTAWASGDIIQGSITYTC